MPVKQQQNPRVSAIIVAAGIGARFGTSSSSQHKTIHKPFVSLDGVPILIKTLQAFHPIKDIREIILVLHRTDIQWAKKTFKDSFAKLNVRGIVAGGKTRQESVWNGIQQTSPRNQLIAIHDGVRPFVQPSLIRKLITKANQTGAAIPGIPVTDTIKIANARRKVLNTPTRSTLWQIQTPQIFLRETIISAHWNGRQEHIDVTDDAQLVELNGDHVFIVRGQASNRKITVKNDL